MKLTDMAIKKAKPREKVYSLGDGNGYAIEEPYNKENLNILLDNYLSASHAISSTYYNELLSNCKKNLNDRRGNI